MNVYLQIPVRRRCLGRQCRANEMPHGTPVLCALIRYARIIAPVALLRSKYESEQVVDVDEAVGLVLTPQRSRGGTSSLMPLC
jgi:hypothetical protein